MKKIINAINRVCFAFAGAIFVGGMFVGAVLFAPSITITNKTDSMDPKEENTKSEET